MEKHKEQPANSASEIGEGSTSNSKLRYPLRSALKSKEGKPPAPESSASSSSKRGTSLHAVSQSQSTTTLHFSAKDDKSAKPTRRFPIPAKSAGSSARKSRSSLTPVSESRLKRSGNARGMTEKNVFSALRLANREKGEDLFSATYWLSQIKLSESAAKHLISLGFFKLAHQADCEPLQQMREELKSYACRNNLDELEDAMKELCQLYNISEDPKQPQISETCSVVPEETTVTLNTDAQSASSTPENLNMMPQIPKQDDASQSSIVTRTAKEKSVKNTPQGRTQRSLKDIKVNPENDSEVQESEEETRSSDDGVANVTARSSHVKRKNRKEAASKNNPPVRTKKLATISSANTQTLPETRRDKSQKKAERTVNSRTKRNQEEKHEKKKSTKKSVGKQEVGEMDPVEDNKENAVARAAEEIQVE